jgi:hypothetical protein
MGRRAAVVALMTLMSLGVVAPAGPAAAEEIVVLQETRTPEKDKRSKKTVLHLAVLKNTGSRAVQHLRVTIELYDHFGALLWARTASPSPTSLRPGDTATLSLTTPHLPEHRRTAYRFDYRAP